MKKMIVLLNLVLFSSALFAQVYSTTGSVLPIDPGAPDAGGDFYNLEVPDDILIENVKVRVIAHTIDFEGDTVSVLDNFGIEVWHEGETTYLFDHNCTYTEFSNLDLTFSHDASDFANYSCGVEGTFRPTSVNRFGEPVTTDLTVYEGMNANGLWQFFVTWKGYVGGGAPDIPLSVDSLILIFDDETSVSIGTQSELEKMTIYPNPTNGSRIVNVQMPQNSTYDITLYSIGGQVVFNQNNCEGATAIAVPELSQGVYIMEVVRANGIREQRKVILN